MQTKAENRKVNARTPNEKHNRKISPNEQRSTSLPKIEQYSKDKTHKRPRLNKSKSENLKRELFSKNKR